MTLLAVLIGAVTVVFAVGLAGSLSRGATALDRTAAVPIAVHLNDTGTRRPAHPASAAIREIIQAQTGTAHVAGAWDGTVHAAGTAHPVTATAYDGDSSWTGYELIAGRWCTGPDEVVAGSRLLRSTGTTVGDTLTLSTERGRRDVRVAGEVFDTGNAGHNVIGPATALSELLPPTGPQRFEVGLTKDADPEAYGRSLNNALAEQRAWASVRDYENVTLAIMLGLVATLTILLSAVAALGVFNTAVLNTRERAHEIGVLKSIGMTPCQVRVMVITSTTAIGIVAGLLAVPLGYALHHRILPVMGNAAGTGVPPGVIDVYSSTQLTALAAAGVVLAVLGALLPADWAARSRAATSLRAE
jgi:putative ABC transport system permease protein